MKNNMEDRRGFQRASKAKRREAHSLRKGAVPQHLLSPENHLGRAGVIIGRVEMSSRLGTESWGTRDATSMGCIYTHTCLRAHTEL